jgi:hypothetical protein
MQRAVGGASGRRRQEHAYQIISLLLRQFFYFCTSFTSKTSTKVQILTQLARQHEGLRNAPLSLNRERNGERALIEP